MFALTLSTMLLSVCGGVQSPRAPQNIVVILADDMGFASLHAEHPDSGLPTPNLDRLHAQSMSFTDAHSGSAVCSPTRYGLLTGRYAWRTRMKSGIVAKWGPPLIAEDRVTLADIAHEASLHTACIGKWHLGWRWPTADGGTTTKAVDVDYSKPIGGGPLEAGFDHYFGDDVPNWPPYTWFEDDRILIEPTDTMPAGVSDGVRGGPSATDWSLKAVMPELTRRCVTYIRDRAQADEPFLLYYSMVAPHTPIEPSDSFKGISGVSTYADFLLETDWSAQTQGCPAASSSPWTTPPTIMNNSGRKGAGVWLEGVTLHADTVLFEENTIVNSGSGDGSGAGGGIYAKSLGGNGAPSELTLDTCSLLGNQAVNGGGLYLAVGSAAEFIGGQCSGNGADAGGGMIVDDSTVTLDGVDVIGNTSTGGAAVVTWDTGSLAVSNTTICGNGPDPGNGAYGDPISGNVTDLGGNCISIDCDTDDDGTYDCDDGCPDDPNKTDPGQCGCGVPDTDTDGDGTADCIDGCPDDPLKTEPGDCGCGVADEDADGNGISDCLESDCPGDADGSTFVNIEDLLVVLGEYGPCPEGCAADFDQDGDVDIDDMLVVIGNWGPCS